MPARTDATNGEAVNVTLGTGGEARPVIKCVVWDLDNTLWDGVLLEDQDVSLRDGVASIVRELDSRGILNSIASRSDYYRAMEKLRELGLDECFLYPQIAWGSKVASIRAIGQALHIGLNSIAFIDDEPFERDEVRFSLPEVTCFDAVDIDQLLDAPGLKPRVVTEDSRLRRQMYVADMVRLKAEEEFVGPRDEFLASLGMVLTIFPAPGADLQRAEELTVRTNQLNSTGYTYSYDQLACYSQSERHKLLMARLEDRYGSYGHIALALLETGSSVWTLKLLLTSCRVMSRGVGSILLSHIMQMAKHENVRLLAEFIPNGRNRLMNITLRLAGFHEVERLHDCVILEGDLSNVAPSPGYVQVRIADRAT